MNYFLCEYNFIQSYTEKGTEDLAKHHGNFCMFRKIVIWALFTKSRICELSISMIQYCAIETGRDNEIPFYFPFISPMHLFHTNSPEGNFSETVFPHFPPFSLMWGKLISQSVNSVLPLGKHNSPIFPELPPPPQFPLNSPEIHQFSQNFPGNSPILPEFPSNFPPPNDSY